MVALFDCLVYVSQNQEYRLATKALSAERSRWISEGYVDLCHDYKLHLHFRSVDRLIRASRHYERAAQMLTRQTVATARGVIIKQIIIIACTLRNCTCW